MKQLFEPLIDDYCNAAIYSAGYVGQDLEDMVAHKLHSAEVANTHFYVIFGP
jgi:ATP-dependent protease Clp ATPase subunit